MAREIERKFLLKNSSWKKLAYKKTHFSQAYLNGINNGACKSSIRIRIEGDKANLNIKSLEIGISRDEYEYSINLADAQQMIKTLAVGSVVEKHRYLVENAGSLWEIDEFLGDNNGLVVAEIELKSVDEKLVFPSWIRREVTELVRYYNISLSQNPYSQWTEDEQSF